MKRLPLALAAGLATFAAIGASASSLGGMDSVALGADQSVIVSCDRDGVGVSYRTDADTEAGYRITAVDLSGIDAACHGQTVKVNLVGDTGPLTELSGTVTGAQVSLPVTAAVPASAPSSVAVTITG